MKIGFEASYSNTQLPTNTLLTTNTGTCSLEFVSGIPPQVVSLSLVNADTGTSIGQITDGAMIDLANLSTQNLNIRAQVAGSTESILFVLEGAENYSRIENVTPYVLFGDIDGDFNAWTPGVGTYTLTAVPYKQDNIEGAVGNSLTITFSVTGN